ncbi:hypothetical protein PTKIN_Ptkin16aG0523000 [Pterospermum kingtungense]
MEKQIESHKEQKKWLRLFLFPLPFQGHISPMLQLANVLYSKGFSITIIHTSYNSPNPSHNPHFTFHSIPDGRSKTEASTADNIVDIISLLNANCAEPFRDCLAKLLSDVPEEEPIACLISDVVWNFTDAAADSLKLPRLVFRTNNVSSFLSVAALPLLQEKGNEHLEAPVLEFPPLKLKDLPVFRTQNQESLYQSLTVMVKKAKSYLGLIWNSFEELEHEPLTKFRHDFRIPTFPIGPLHKYFPVPSSSLLSQDQRSIIWLDRQAPKTVLYVSFGSLVSIGEAELVEIAWGLANSHQPFLWVVRSGSVTGSERVEALPNEFMEEIRGRGHIVTWAPQQEVLAHPAIGGFWTHNGWNSTLESICEAVPMICHPCFGDQRVNARYVSDVWRIGVHLENRLDRVEIARAVKKLLVEDEGKAIRKRVMQLQKMADQCIQQSGSSYQSLESLVSFIVSLQSDRT